jgi:GTP cyclohydrolase I
MQEHGYMDSSGVQWTHPGPLASCMHDGCVDRRFRGVTFDYTEGTTEWMAEQLLSSMEAWDRTPEDHRAETPKRFVAALRQLTERQPFNFTTFPTSESGSEMVTLGPIPFYTLCAHHVVPFYGNAWIGYVPDKKLAGLSKFARAVKWAAKGFWVQEELTTEIADFLEAQLEPLGVAVVLRAEHMCMAMRGVETAGVLTTTSAMRGVFADHSRTAKAEFTAMIGKGN